MVYSSFVVSIPAPLASGLPGKALGLDTYCTYSGWAWFQRVPAISEAGAGNTSGDRPEGVVTLVDSWRLPCLDYYYLGGLLFCPPCG